MTFLKNLGRPSKSTIIITIVFFIGMVNGVLTMLGKPILEIGEMEVTGAVDAASAAVSAIWLIVSGILAWWNNMSVTKPAIRADEALATGMFADDVEEDEVE